MKRKMRIDEKICPRCSSVACVILGNPS